MPQKNRKHSMKHSAKATHEPHARLSIRQILRWADDHAQRHQRWPMDKSGIANPGDPHPISWRSIDFALQYGSRGLPGGSTLSTLLEQKRGKPKSFYLVRPTNKQILDWAYAEYERTGKWPHKNSRDIPEAPEIGRAHV